MIVKGRSCREIWEQLLPMLPVLYREEIKRVFEYPLEDHDDEWIERLKKFIFDRIRLADSAIKHGRKSVRFLGETAAKLMDLSAKRIALEERLDAMIDRALKRFAQLKTFKEIVATKDAGAPRNLPAR
jgi:hypothetical protein